MRDSSSQKLSTTMKIQKFDHEIAEEPVLMETITMKDGVVTEKVVHSESTQES
jgi:hypothetical protein